MKTMSVREYEMNKRINCGICILDFDYDNIKFEKHINAFPSYCLCENKLIEIKIIYITKKIDMDCNFSSPCNLDLDPQLIKYYESGIGKDCLWLKTGILFKRDFIDKSMTIINEEIDLKVDLSGFIETFISNVLYTTNWMTFHGAVLIKDDKGIAFLGQSGSGKSSTIIQLLCQCDGILSNDLFCMNLESGQIVSLDRTIGARKGENDFVNSVIESWGDKDILYEYEQKYFLLDNIPEIKYIKKAKLSKIIFCQIDDSISEVKISKVKGIELFRCFIETCIKLSKMLNIDYDQIFVNVLSNYPCFVLKLPSFKMGSHKNIFTSNFIEKLEDIS